MTNWEETRNPQHRKRNARPNPKMHHTASKTSPLNQIREGGSTHMFHTTRTDPLQNTVDSPKSSVCIAKEGRREGGEGTVQSTTSRSTSWYKCLCRFLQQDYNGPPPLGSSQKKQHELSDANRNTRITLSLLFNPTLAPNLPDWSSCLPKISLVSPS